MKNSLTLILLTLMLILPSCSGNHFKKVQANDNSISYVGRFAFSKDMNAVSDWPGTYFRCRFTGQTLGLLLDGPSGAQFNVFIDGKQVKTISCMPNDTIWISRNLSDEEHRLVVYRRTEAFLGKAVFKGIIIDAKAKVLRWIDLPSHKIEFIGNSITCGYGVEGASRHDRFLPETENNYLTYAAVTSRSLDADYFIIAHSGLGIVRHYGDSLKVSTDPQMPVKYLRTFDGTDSLKWDFKSWKPDVVVVNLGTNDFSTQPYPDKEVFQSEYTNLIHRIRNNYGKIPVFCVCGPLIGDPCLSYIKEVTDNVRVNEKDDNLFFVEVPKAMLNSDEDYGSDEHPSVKGQQKIADVLISALTSKLGGKVTAAKE
jgi:hypothetical protein